MAELKGTRPFGLAETGWSHDFTDQYAKQWNHTYWWMQESLAELRRDRDRQRQHDSRRRAEHRSVLSNIAGAALFEESVADVRLFGVAGQTRARAYTVQTAAGLTFTGELHLPDSDGTRGMVVYCGADRPAAQDRVVERYQNAGFYVLQPYLSRNVRTFRGGEANAKGRQHYAHPDHETLHFLSFVLGGSLAGLEAAELRSVQRALADFLGFPADFPVVVDLRDRRTLTGAVACALYPDWATTLLLHPEARYLDCQEMDVRANTLWGFHRYFDGLTLMQLAEKTDLLFVDEGGTPSELAARTLVFFNEMGNRRVERCAPDDVVKTLAAGGALAASRRLREGMEETLDSEGLDQLYVDALERKLDALDREHARALDRKNGRYDLSGLDGSTYRQRVEDALQEVVGPPVPRADDLRIRTRSVNSDGQYDVYEVLMESVPGIDVAGYLLIPRGRGPFPAVICQHGLLGRPEDLLGLSGANWIYAQIARVMVEKECVVFVPFMNWGWGGVPYRDALAKHAYALGIATFRFEAAQLEAVVDFLSDRSEVISERIAFYGLSYGGHASMWLGALEERLAAVVTAGHFNDWHRKLTSTAILPPMTLPRSFICVDDSLDMFNYNVLNVLGHAELATRHAPRPYMVENGLLDAVAAREWVDDEYERVEAVYEWFGAPQAARLTHFPGPHRIWAEESLIFLRETLKYGSESGA